MQVRVPEFMLFAQYQRIFTIAPDQESARYNFCYCERAMARSRYAGFYRKDSWLKTVRQK